ncbi:hypothetical protein ACEYW6_10410 [Nostoc sp. UIC 10607]|uniref:hypothetical protein n=1 Tax=Nostoc sp. UIC 10607 TaxID=3045935 RepID=UPI00399F112B
MLEELNFLIERYNLQWILFEGQVRFVVGHLAKAKGVNSKDFAKNFIVNGKCILPGNFELLTGDRLKIFKYNFNYRYEKAISRARQLWVSDYLGAFSYVDGYNNSDTSNIRFLETDLERAYQNRYGGNRQLVIKGGRLDVIVGDKIVELKKDKVDCNSIGQLLRYLEFSKRTEGELAAPDISDDAILLLKIVNQSGFNISYKKVKLNYNKTNQF